MNDLKKYRPVYVLPTVFDDSLSYYEVLGKIITAIKDLDERVTALEEAQEQQE